MIGRLIRFMNYFLNPLKHRALARAGRLPAIEWMVYEITDACNSRCRHCNIWQEKPTANQLTKDEIARIFADPLLAGLKAVLITGGEPVLRPDLAEIFLAIHQVRPRTRLTLSTNGLLPERVLAVVRQCLAQGLPLDVGISLDAVGDLNDEIRGVKGNYERVDHLLKELAKIKAESGADFQVIVGHTLSPLTVATVDEVKSYAEKRQAAFLTQLYDEATYYHNLGGLATSPADQARMSAAIDKLPPSFHKEFLQQVLRHKIIRFNCFALRTFFVLRCNGDVVPCLQKSHRPIGNLKQRSLAEIWTGPAAETIRGEVTACAGCANSWAINWSMKADFYSFIPMLLRTLRNKLIPR